MNLEYGKKKSRSLNNNRKEKKLQGKIRLKKFNKYRRRTRSTNQCLNSSKLKKGL